MRHLTALVATSLILASCASQETEATTGDPGPVGVFASELVALDNCDELLDYYTSNALEIVGPYGLGGYGGPWFGVDTVAEAARDDAGVAVQAAQSRDYTDTNVQVEGVDEADIVKTDGFRIVTALDDHLRTWEVGSPGVTHVGSLQLPFWPQAMFLRGDTVVTIGGVWDVRPLGPSSADIAPSYGSSITRIAEIDISNMADPAIVRTVDLDGAYVQSRLVDGSLRVAINSNPVGFEWKYPTGGGLRAEREATEANREIIRNSTIANWLPYSVVTEGRSESEGDLLDCTKVMVPKEFSGLSTLSLLMFDVDAGVSSWDGAGVVASGATMYATAEHTYLATQRWMDWWAWDEATVQEEADGFTTSIHLFETVGSPTYVASGSVTGFLLNQFSMDEYDGHLRVASTTAPQGWWWSDHTESLVTVLERQGAELAAVGQVGGLGEGEQIYAVRFIQGMGYVVTFRQTDPLYTVDLSNPTNPTVTGELKILGYSAYLHPVGDGLILGLGQDADDAGRTKGTQLSLFDVSDPSNPRRLDTVTMDGGWSQAEGDHHAFTYTDGLALAPYQRWDWIEDESGGRSMFDTGVIAARIDGTELSLGAVLRPIADGPIEEKDWVGRDPWAWSPTRTIVIDDFVYTISQAGIAIHDASSFERIETVELSKV
ncbi:MAG TPA: beta-propeller domain-containing protein [Acidimicrobiia bacterium]